ncbi:Ig-like domain-containing protein, partial [Filimonas zeae]
ALPEMEKSVGLREVCAGSSVTLTNGSTGGAGVWSSSNTVVATVDNNGLVHGVVAGNAVITYTVTTAKGCVSQDTARMTVNALPEMEKSIGAREVCAGSTVTLTNGSTGGTGVWSSSAVSVATVDNNGLVRGVAAGNTVITYTVTTAKGCLSVDTAHIAVNALPEMEKSVGLREVCAGSTVTLTNSSTGGVGVWSSSAVGVATVDNNGLVRGVAAGNAVITYTVTTAKGCVSVDTAHIAVNALPEMENSVGLREVCAGSAVTLTNGSTGGTGVWSSSPVSVATIDNNGVVRGVSAGSAVITYTVTTAKGCVSVDTAHVLVNALPEMEKSVGLREVCAGSAVTLTNGSTGGTGVWSSSAVSVATVDNSGVVRGVSAGSAVITYTVTTAKGCVSVDTAHVLVNALPEMEKSVGAREVCAGSTVTLTNGSTGGTGVWSSSAVSVATVDNDGLVRGVAAGSAVITYTVTTAKGCVSVDTAQVLVNALPKLSEITGANEICVHGTVQMGNAAAGGVWKSDNSAICSIDQQGLAKGVAPGQTIIHYTVTTPAGCSADTQMAVLVNPVPEFTVIAKDVRCFREENGSVIGSAELPLRYSLNNGAYQSGGRFDGLKAGEYTITAMNSLGCAVEQKVIVGQPKALVLSATKVDIDCHSAATGSIDLSVMGGTAPYTYTWNNGPTTQDLSGLTAGGYFVQVKDSVGCNANLSIALREIIGVFTVNPPVRRTNGDVVITGVTIPNATVLVIYPGVALIKSQAAADGTFSVASSGAVTAGNVVVSVIDAATGATCTNTIQYGSSASADIALTKKLIASENVSVGSRVKFVITATNKGPDDASHVVVNDQLIAMLDGVDSIVASKGTVTYNSVTKTVEWVMDSLHMDSTAQLSFRVGVIAAGTLRNTATVIATENDPNPNNNTASIEPMAVTDKFMIPNVITPNGNGKNDRFVIPGVPTTSRMEIAIFNRWGSEVYRSKNYDNRWDGTGLSAGVYYYVLKIISGGNEQAYKGYIQVLK